MRLSRATKRPGFAFSTEPGLFGIAARRRHANGLMKRQVDIECSLQRVSPSSAPIPAPPLNGLRCLIAPPYNCRHTYATICLKSNLNPAFIAQQLGHSVQMLLTVYARWLNSSSDWGSWKRSRLVSNRYQAKNTSSKPLIGKVIDLHS